MLKMKYKIKFIHYHPTDTDFDECSVYLSNANVQLFKQASFVELNLFTNDENRLLNTRKCICTPYDRADDDSIYLSAILWFNLTNQCVLSSFTCSDQYHITVSLKFKRNHRLKS